MGYLSGECFRPCNPGVCSTTPMGCSGEVITTWHLMALPVIYRNLMNEPRAACDVWHRNSSCEPAAAQAIDVSPCPGNGRLAFPPSLHSTKEQCSWLRRSYSWMRHATLKTCVTQGCLTVVSYGYELLLRYYYSCDVQTMMHALVGWHRAGKSALSFKRGMGSFRRCLSGIGKNNFSMGGSVVCG